jgi:hypothetical protein
LNSDCSQMLSCHRPGPGLLNDPSLFGPLFPLVVGQSFRLYSSDNHLLLLLNGHCDKICPVRTHNHLLLRLMVLLLIDALRAWLGHHVYSARLVVLLLMLVWISTHYLRSDLAERRRRSLLVNHIALRLSGRLHWRA